MFADIVTLDVAAGDGGNGIIAWRREKYLPKGGPVGGDGGRGGSVYFVASQELYSLEGLRNRRIIKAQHGEQGGTACCQGGSGADRVVQVPCGTLVRCATTGEVLADLIEDGQRYRACTGGKGGYGNHHFRSPSHQAPYRCTPGTAGEQRTVVLELKLIAEVGFVGFPNAGKSTLLGRLTAVKPKIAPYPFTTLVPNLGFMIEGQRRLLLADIPGIIEGAHQNRGLGHAFLKHIERTRLLLFVLDASGWEERHPLEDLRVLMAELEAYDPALLEKPAVVAFNKAEVDPDRTAQWMEEYAERWPALAISAVTGQGLEALRHALFQVHAETAEAECACVGESSE